MGKWIAFLTLFAVAIGLAAVSFPSAVRAELPYRTWFVDRETGRPIHIQPLYVPSRAIGYAGMDIPLSGPSDLFIGPNDHVYVADTGNNRIVEFDGQGSFIRGIGTGEGKGKLSGPEGVFVAADGTVYAADTGNERIAVYAADGTFVREYGKPQSPLLPDQYFYVPTKLAVDARGVMYIVVKDSYQGLLRMNAKGEFTGFFGANKTKLDWLDRLKRKLLNKEQLAKETAKRPDSIGNVSIGPDGFLLTVSSGTGRGQLKKLNAGGADAFGNRRFSEHQLADASGSQDGFIYALNREFGEVVIYNQEGDPLFYFGDTDKTAQQMGAFRYPVSIAVNRKNELWVTDNGMNLIQVFERTAFGESFLTAAKLYGEGKYMESKPFWEDVMKQNDMMGLPYSGMGKIAAKEQRYKEAMAYFTVSYDAEGYSDAFWNVRYEWIRHYLPLAVAALVIGAFLLRFAGKRSLAYASGRRWPPFVSRLVQEAKDAHYVFFHPYEGFYRLKERKVSWLMISILVLSAVAIRFLSVYAEGFLFHPYDIGTIDLRLHVGLFFVPWLTWVFANYLVSAVKGGEGRFREVLQASAYALVPYVLLMIPIILISNVVVLEERIAVDALQQLMWLWIVVLFFVSTQVIHNFEFLETVKISLISLITIAVIWIFLVILSGLAYNLFDFMRQIYREVTFYG